jgi:hypothetical protein
MKKIIFTIGLLCSLQLTAQVNIEKFNQIGKHYKDVDISETNAFDTKDKNYLFLIESSEETDLVYSFHNTTFKLDEILIMCFTDEVFNLILAQLKSVPGALVVTDEFINIGKRKVFIQNFGVPVFVIK